MPFVDPSFLAGLAADAAGHEAAIARLDDRWLQTTQAVYRAEPMAAACDRALARGDRKVLAPLDDLDCVVVGGDAEIRERTTAHTFTSTRKRSLRRRRPRSGRRSTMPTPGDRRAGSELAEGRDQFVNSSYASFSSLNAVSSPSSPSGWSRFARSR